MGSKTAEAIKELAEEIRKLRETIQSERPFKRRWDEYQPPQPYRPPRPGYPWGPSPTLETS